MLGEEDNKPVSLSLASFPNQACWNIDQDANRGIIHPHLAGWKDGAIERLGLQPRRSAPVIQHLTMNPAYQSSRSWSAAVSWNSLMSCTAILGAVGHCECAPAHPTTYPPNQNIPTTMSRPLPHSLQAAHSSRIRRVHRLQGPRRRGDQLGGSAE